MNVKGLMAHDDKTVALEGPDDTFKGKAGDNAQRVSSTNSRVGDGTISSSTGSKYRPMASRMFCKASSLLFPSLMQPGRAGTYMVNPPSCAGSRTT